MTFQTNNQSNPVTAFLQQILAMRKQQGAQNIPGVQIPDNSIAQPNQQQPTGSSGVQSDDTVQSLSKLFGYDPNTTFGYNMNTSNDQNSPSQNWHQSGGFHSLMNSMFGGNLFSGGQ